MDSQQVGQGNILIVDDVLDHLELLSKILTKKGYQVRSVDQATQALEIVQSGWAELILLDIGIPKMDGFQICQKLKTDPSTNSIPVIFLSASDRILYKINAFAVGGVDYITKPFQIKEVLARVHTHLELRNLQKTLEEQVKARTIELTKALEGANAANHAKSLFFSQITHELRTPLNAILGFTQIMQRDKTLNPEHQEQLRIINQSGEHLLGLINDVLEMSKIEAGCSILEPSDFDLYQLLNEIEAMLRFKAQAKGLEFIITKAENTPQFITTDQQKLRQILINLIANAVKFTETGKIIVRVATSKLNPQKQLKLLFEVEDTGQGIAASELPRLFQPFTQTKTGKQSQSGTGLGLSISRQYVQLMQGDISVNSLEGKGTTFKFNIQANLAPAIESTPKTKQRIVGLMSKQSKYRILVVEDHWENRYLLLKLLTTVGFEVLQAANGQECLELWESWSPHLIFMNMQMPVMDGYEATKRIKANARDQKVVIIALTATEIKQHRQEIFAAGCDDFINIPFSEELLWSKIAKHLNVQYIYEQLVPTEQLRSHVLYKSPADKKLDDLKLVSSLLKSMPTYWVAQLHYLAQAADGRRINDLIGQIPCESSFLADFLQDLVDNFCFESIIELIDRHTPLT